MATSLPLPSTTTSPTFDTVQAKAQAKHSDYNSHSTLSFFLPNSPNTASEAIQLGLVGLLTRPVIKAVFPSDRNVISTSEGLHVEPTLDKNAESAPQTAPTTASTTAPAPASGTESTPESTELASPHSNTQSSPITTGAPRLLAATYVPALGGSVSTQSLNKTAESPVQPVQQLQFPTPTVRPELENAEVAQTPVTEQEPTALQHNTEHQASQTPRSPPTPIVTEPHYVPLLYTQEGTHPVPMAAVAPQSDASHYTGTNADGGSFVGTNGRNSIEDHDYALSQKAQNLDLNDRQASRPASRPASRATHRTTNSQMPNGGLNHGLAQEHNQHELDEDDDGPAALNREGEQQMGLETPVAEDSNQYRHSETASQYRQSEEADRPSMNKRASRSYVAPIPIVTTYEREFDEEPVQQRPKSVAGSHKAPSVKAASVKRPASKAPSIRSNKGTSTIAEQRPPRPASVAGSTRHLPQLNENDINGQHGQNGGFAVGEVASPDRQHQLQGGNRQSIQDHGHMTRDRSTTFEEPQMHHQPQRAMSPSSPQRPQSAFGYRPQPNLMSINESEQNDVRNDGRDSRAGVLNRNGTVLSRAGTLGRNGTLSRGANGGTVGSRRGAFGRGAGTNIGTQPEEVLGRDDIHMRAELSERILDEATLRKLSTMEKKDAKRLTKVMKQEGKAEAKAVSGSIRELERLTKLQREAAAAERKSQLRLSKYTSKEHKARLRFLKEKERYEKVEGELRNAENDYEERRDHAAGLTSQVAEKQYELDDARAQKAADDRERAVKMLALKNPGHS
ncbi:hypothetical protein IAU60_002199 [Kwoniella sp. DSM 27419]